jgi:DNA-binding NtrC family response regulator
MTEKQLNVLFVDDEKNILNALNRELMDEVYNKKFAENGEEALRVMTQNEIAVIVTDLNMPQINGIDLLYSVKKLYPDTVRIILTSYSEISIVLDAIYNGETHRYLTKPWKSIEELKVVINQSIDMYLATIEKKENIRKINELNTKLLAQKEQIEFLSKMTNQNKEGIIKKYSENQHKTNQFLFDFIKTGTRLRDLNKLGEFSDLYDKAIKLKEELDDSRIITSIETSPG